ncbi:helix-turn-helix transcriptional regulator [Rhodococcus sp. IEGM 1343]|uniref:helix-turn-helix transcriptional regulator n=1 Tax=Rhodococcus sp. IEGM 1343 TaxID=3082224 RepID=UPI0029533695|nr:LuxR C-terminal-related transcriptional regulator [Rhodococcus sp. IEGM 1343]MDV8055553.1 LuxR C-terminal-related transcriptional regulator [Rhodococcus sp. IEGM 1343]
MARTLIGRDAELAALEQVVADAARGVPAAAVVSGDAGVGKTRLLAELRRNAEARATRVLVGRCLDLGEVGIPYLAFTELFGPLLHTTRTELFDAALVALAAAGADRPAVLIVEDAHWADTSTRELMTFLLSRLAKTRVALMISYRSDDLHRKHPLRQSLSEWTRLSYVRRVDLPALDAESSYRLLDSLPAATDVASRDVIVERSGGNPFFIEELVSAGQRPGSSIPPGLAELLLVRLDALSPTAKSVAETMAVGGPRVAHEVLTEVTGLDEDRLEDVIREIVDARLVETTDFYYVFRHALLAEAIYDDVLPGRRARLHASFVDTLTEHRHRGAAADLARHAGLAHDLPKAFRAHVDAGREAMTLAAPAEAMAHLAAALELRQPQWEPTETALVLEYAVASTTAGQDMRALSVVRAELERGGDALSIPDRLDLLHAEATSALAIEREDSALVAVEQALIIADAEEFAPWRVQLTALGARITDSLGREDQSLAWAEESVRIAESLGDPGRSADARITLARLHGRHNDPAASRTLLVRTAALARESGDIGDLLRSKFNLGMVEFDDGNFLSAQESFEEAVEIARSTGRQWTPYGVGARVQLANVRYYSGDWTLALADLARIESAAPPLGSAEQLCAGFQIRAAIGDEELAADIERVRPYESQDGFITILRSAAVAYTALCNGRFSEVIACIEDAVATVGAQWHNPWFGGRIRLSVLGMEAARRGSAVIGAQAALDIGSRLHSEIERTASSSPSYGWESTAWIRRGEAELGHLRLNCGYGDAASVVAAWRAAVDAFAIQPFERARALQSLSEALEAAGDRSASAHAADEANAIYDRLGATVRLGDTRRPAGADLLTRREWDVLELVGEGCTNKQIAERLVISVKTVSVHVSNVLTKLGAQNRTEAARFAKGKSSE